MCNITVWLNLTYFMENDLPPAASIIISIEVGATMHILLKKLETL